MPISRLSALAALILTLTLLSPHATAGADTSPVPPLRALIVGGGPDRKDNQVAIESNVRYVRSILDKVGTVRTLYANGSTGGRIVQYEDSNGNDEYRPTRLKDIDGPASRRAFRRNLDALTAGDGNHTPLLLYFTGHGSPDEAHDYADNGYDLWGDDELYVSDLKESLRSVDSQTPVTLIMVQCYSGGFSNLFFTEHSPDKPAVRPGSCGFFASLAEREAAGCTSEVNEADYRDFTTYFFGALSGHDRVGRPITNADYDHDGTVEMNEAYAYALINDRSIDTPVATSDTYVRRFAQETDAQIFATPYSEVISYADRPQRAALVALSAQLKLTGDGRLKTAYSVFTRRTAIDEDSKSEEEEERTVRWIRFVRLAKTIVLEHAIETNGAPAVRDGLRELLAAEHGTPLRK